MVWGANVMQGGLERARGDRGAAAARPMVLGTDPGHRRPVPDRRRGVAVFRRTARRPHQVAWREGRAARGRGGAGGRRGRCRGGGRRRPRRAPRSGGRRARRGGWRGDPGTRPSSAGTAVRTSRPIWSRRASWCTTLCPDPQREGRSPVARGGRLSAQAHDRSPPCPRPSPAGAGDRRGPRSPFGCGGGGSKPATSATTPVTALRPETRPAPRLTPPRPCPAAEARGFTCATLRVPLHPLGARPRHARPARGDGRPATAQRTLVHPHRLPRPARRPVRAEEVGPG